MSEFKITTNAITEPRNYIVYLVHRGEKIYLDVTGRWTNSIADANRMKLDTAFYWAWIFSAKIMWV